MTVRMYANRQGLAARAGSSDVAALAQGVKDCADCETRQGMDRTY